MNRLEAKKIKEPNNPSVWSRVRDRIEEIESRLGFLRVELASTHSPEVQARMQRLKDRFEDVMKELNQYDDSNDLVRKTKSEFESLLLDHHIIRDRDDSSSARKR